jgi:hypothetical protein
MTTLTEAYERRDKSRLEIGSLALVEIKKRIAEDAAAGHTAPYRTALSETLTQLSQEYARFHASESSCRSYLSDSIRLSRFFVPDVVAELEQYHLTTSHMLACLKGGEFPDADHDATQRLVDWTIENQASPQQIWEYRRGIEKQLDAEQSAWLRILRAIERYLDISVTLSGAEIDARRKICNKFAQSEREDK